MVRKSRSDARERILDAALAVADRVGAAHLTLDAVATEAGVSKGGLLYHFASKDLLLKGVVEHHMEQHRSDLEIAYAGKDHMDVLLPVERIKKVDRLPARVGEQGINPLLL